MQSSFILIICRIFKSFKTSSLCQNLIIWFNMYFIFSSGHTIVRWIWFKSLLYTTTFYVHIDFYVTPLVEFMISKVCGRCNGKIGNPFQLKRLHSAHAILLILSSCHTPKIRGILNSSNFVYTQCLDFNIYLREQCSLPIIMIYIF